MFHAQVPAPLLNEPCIHVRFLSILYSANELSFQSSSAVEQSAVNRSVAGSIPAFGVHKKLSRPAMCGQESFCFAPTYMVVAQAPHSSSHAVPLTRFSLISSLTVPS